MFAADSRRADQASAPHLNLPAPEAPPRRDTGDGQGLLLMVALYVMALIGGAVLLRVLTPVSNDPTLIVTAVDSQSR